MKYWVALLVGFGFAVVVHLLAWNTLSNLPFIYLSFPGMIAHVLVTGPHGGTITQERIGLALEIAVNSFVYSALLWSLAKLFRRLQGRATQQ